MFQSQFQQCFHFRPNTTISHSPIVVFVDFDLFIGQLSQTLFVDLDIEIDTSQLAYRQAVVK